MEVFILETECMTFIDHEAQVSEEWNLGFDSDDCVQLIQFVRKKKPNWKNIITKM